MGIGDICRFGFMDPPQPQRVKYALQRLKALGAVDKEERITSLGFQMSEFPLAPHLSKILLTAADMGCSDEVLTIVSMLSVKYVFIRPHHKFRRKQKVRTVFVLFLRQSLKSQVTCEASVTCCARVLKFWLSN